jgi:hypothetical protein
MVEVGRRIHEAVARVTMRLAREVRLQDEREHAQEMLQRDADEAAWELSEAAKARQQNNDDDFYIDMNGKAQRRGA